jgi:hypothetical protein
LPYFFIISAWLLILLLAGGLAFMRHTRRLAAYLAVCSTSGVLVSFVVSTVALILAAEVPQNTLPGLALLIGGYLGGIVMGGLMGVGLSFWLLYRYTGRRSDTVEPIPRI